MVWTPGSTRHLQHFPFLWGQRGVHARFWYRIGTDDLTRTTINDDGEERVCVRGTSLAFLSAMITCHGTMSLLTTTSSSGIWWPQSCNTIRISTTSANGGTYAGQYPCDGWVENLKPAIIVVIPNPTQTLPESRKYGKKNINLTFMLWNIAC